MKKIILVIMLSLLCACSSGAPASDVQEDTPIQSAEAKQFVLEDLVGTVSVNDGEKDQEAFAGMNLYSGYGVRTETESFDWILLDEEMLVKMNEDSKTSITQEGNGLKIFLEEGDLFFCVNRELEEDEELSFETENASLSIRGTCGIVRHHGGITYFAILEGEGEVAIPGEDSVHGLSEGRCVMIWKDGTTSYDHISPGGDVQDFVVKEINDNEMVKQRIEEVPEYKTDAEMEEIASYLPGKFLYTGYIGMKSEHPELDFSVKDPYTLEFIFHEDKSLDIIIEESKEAYDTIENYNKVNEEKGYGGHLNHPGKTISWPFLRLNEYGELYIPGVGTMYLNKENGRFYEMPSYSFGEYKRIEE
ncbi:MAG: FecR domain-containing protein [Erysipelotrichaceae bacterium]|nr:FecR domain-containing protein [Erysipelotrichaceae bacterium]